MHATMASRHSTATVKYRTVRSRMHPCSFIQLQKHASPAGFKLELKSCTGVNGLNAESSRCGCTARLPTDGELIAQRARLDEDRTAHESGSGSLRQQLPRRG